MTAARILVALCAAALELGCHGALGDAAGGNADAAPPDEAAGEPDAGANDCPTPFDLGALLLPNREAAGLPALAAAASSGTCPLATGTVGIRKVGVAAPAKADDAWYLGSCTMAMTAALAAQLVEQGALDWDMTLPEMLPGFDMRDAYRSVTLADLLAHTAGIARDHPLLVELAGATPGTTSEKRAWLMRELLKAPPASEPGAAYSFSNSGYIVAGAIIERVAGASWEELAKQRIFDPLGMSSCGFGHPHSVGQIDGPWGHSGDQSVTASPLSPIYGPASHVHCALLDWARFAALFLDVDDGNAILSAESMQALTTPRTAVESGILYALGWAVVNDGGPFLEHAGTDGTFFSAVLLAPEQDRVYLVAANRGGDDVAPVVQTSLRAIAELLATQ